MDYRYDINTFDNEFINVVVEIPKGDSNKYEINEKSGDSLTIVRKLNKGYLGLELLKSYKYPFNYGFIPGTLADDGDQLDAIVIDDRPITPLTVLKCKVVGVVKTIDNGKQDDKILLIPAYSETKSINIKKILRFLRNYKYPNNDTTEVQGIYDEEEALRIIRDNKLYMNPGK